MLYEMLASSADRYPTQVAIEFNDNLKTYAELRHNVDQFASDLLSLRIGEGDPVVLFLPNGVEFTIAVFAVAKLGAIIVSLNPAFKPKELQYYLKDSGARAFITTPELGAHYGQVIKTINNDCHIIDSIPLRTGEHRIDDLPRNRIGGEVLYQYSSGSTGIPKRVVRTQSNLVHEASNYTSTVGVSHNDKILTVVPMFHAHGFGNCLLASAHVGATMVILQSFTRKRVLNTLVEKRITVFPGVPFMFSTLADSPSVTRMELPDLRLAFSAGAPLSRETFENYQDKFGTAIRQLYGSTETGSVTINHGSPSGALWASVGKSMNNVEVKVVDNHGKSLNANVVGEIIIRSQAITRGYANLDIVNHETFRDGYFWSGDMGKLDENGNLFIVGRKTSFINVGGNKVDPSEIEAVLQKHSAVQESVVVGIPGQHGQETIKAAVVTKRDCTIEEIKGWCSGQLADFKVPRIIEFRKEIPRSPLGKILRKYIKDDLCCPEDM